MGFMNGALGLRLAAGFLAVAFLATGFFLAGAAFLAAGFLAAGFFAADFFAAGFLAGFFAAFFAVAMGLLPVVWCERTMPIDLKRSLLSGYHSIAGDYTAFSQREKSFRKGKRASSVRVLRGAYAAHALTTLALGCRQVALDHP